VFCVSPLILLVSAWCPIFSGHRQILDFSTLLSPLASVPHGEVYTGFVILTEFISVLGVRLDTGRGAAAPGANRADAATPTTGTPKAQGTRRYRTADADPDAPTTATGEENRLADRTRHKGPKQRDFLFARS
jgi:hypothetical protein